MLSEQELAAYFDDTLPTLERQRVEAELERDPLLRRQAFRQSQLDTALRAALNRPANERVKQSVLSILLGTPETALKEHVLFATRHPARRDKSNEALPFSFLQFLAPLVRRPAFGLSVLIACLVLGGAFWWSVRPGTGAQIELPTSVEMAGGLIQPPRGGIIVAGAKHSATMKFADGTTFHLEPGAQIRLEAIGSSARAGGKQLKLLAGSVSAAVAKQPARLPLLIQTPHALITVVGTEFDLNVVTNETALEVTHGLVKVAGTGETNIANVGAGEFAIAAPRAALRFGRLARNPYLWPFSSTSIWNRPLGSEADYVPIPGKGFLNDGPLRDAVRSRRPYMGGPNDRLRRVWVNGEALADARLAENNLPGTRLVDSVVLLQRSRRDALELRDVAVRADGDLEVRAITRTDLAGPGTGDSKNEATPFGLSNLGGLLRTGELEQGIHHALSARTSRERLGGRRSFQQPDTTWPATGGDSPSTDLLKVGTLLAIPPEVDIRGLFGESGPAYELARAMQDYGVYITGFIDAPFVLLADENGPKALDEYLTLLIPHLKVVINNSPAPGGDARAKPAPALLNEIP